MFEAVGKPDFPKIEEEVLRFWDERDIFSASLKKTEGGKEFVFYDGPPFATGLPHYGHLLAGTIKDVVPRYQTMRGRHVDRVFGWDCHGLPVEYEMEKTLKLSGKRQIEAHGVANFNEACRGIVLRYTKEWEAVVRRMGRWVDFTRGYRTMDMGYMESIWWVFKRLWEDGLIYEGYKILPYCPRCSTPLANFEANLGYMDVEDPAITIRLQSVDDPRLFFLAWTTTPWTLPSNMGLAVGPDIDYVTVKDKDSRYVLAESRLAAYYKDPADYEIVERRKGSELVGRRYVPLFSYFQALSEKGAFRIVPADYVSTEDGTGIVHTATGFGEDDAETGRRHGLPEVCPIDEECRFTAEVPDYAGVFVKDADKDIIRWLKTEGKLVHRGTIKHSYPHCWRDDSPLIYRAISTWFVRIDKIKERMLSANSQIRWVPEHIKDGRFGKWLENARDWAISRNRFWGCPLPIWRNKDTGETVCVGSVAELEKLSGTPVTDIHKHFVDALEVPSAKGGAPLRRVPEVLDCWFESGSMPYAQQHYPFENKERFEANFPADFIAEGLDQTRGWFYTLVVLGAALFDKPAFRNVVVNGLVLADDGQKMSKSKKNYPDPQHVINSHGADAIRLFMLGSPVVRGEDLKFSEEGVKEIIRSVFLPMWNSYSFLVTYARLDKWEPGDGEPVPPASPKNPLDRWILSSLCQMIDEIRGHMDGYQLQKAANRFEAFIEDLTNWYIRRSRRRFWKSQNDDDKRDAYQTLHYALLMFTKTAAPFIPFLTEEIYRNLRTDAMPESVHLCDYPEMSGAFRDERLERQMRHTINAVSLGRHLRSQQELKTRQPLRTATIVTHDADTRAMLMETAEIIAEELNVKNLLVKENEEELVIRHAKANFKTLGPRLGKDMKEAAAAIAAFDGPTIASLVAGGSVPLRISSGSLIEITLHDIVIAREEKKGLVVATEGDLTIALDTTLDQALEDEGFAREFVSKIQNLRKELGLEVSDKISIFYAFPDGLSSVIVSFGEYIKNETQAVVLVERAPMDGQQSVDVNGHLCHFTVEKN